MNTALLEVISVFTEACAALVATALAEGNLSLPPSTFSLSLSGRRGAELMPSGVILERFFEGHGLGRLQEGRRLKSLCSAILEVAWTAKSSKLFNLISYCIIRYCIVIICLDVLLSTLLHSSPHSSSLSLSLTLFLSIPAPLSSLSLSPSLFSTYLTSSLLSSVPHSCFPHILRVMCY